MIRHERQYASTKEWIERFERSIAEIRATPGPADILDAEKREVLVRSQESLRDRLRAEIAEYEALRAGTVGRLTVDSLGSLTEALIKARIATGLTQRQLADRLGIAEDQIARDEATDYESASLARVVEVADALGLQIRTEIVLPNRANDGDGPKATAADPADSPAVPVTAGR